MAKVAPMDLVAGVLKGETVPIARLLSCAEAADDASRPALARIFEHTGKAHVVGITGVPGSGKSTLTAVLAEEFANSGRKVGIIAVDPSSPFSGGSILGDRIRMADIAMNPNVFIRSMATRGAMGGLSRGCLDAVDILDAAGFDLILIETVGVGQDEIEIVQAAHTVIVASAPGLGDEIQAIKAGVLEIADIHIVTKCDRSDSNQTIRELKGMLKMGDLTKFIEGWEPKVIGTSSLRREGIAELAAAIDGHRSYLETSGEIVARRRKISETRMLKIAESLIRKRFYEERLGSISELCGQMERKMIAPDAAARQLLARINGE